MTAVTYPKFDERNAPGKVDILNFPERSEFKIEGSIDIGPEDFDNVLDDDYPWQSMPNYDVKQYEKRLGVKKAKLDNVEKYILKRAKYWRLNEIVELSEGQSQELNNTYSTGISKTETQSETKTISEEINYTLGLKLGAKLFDKIDSEGNFSFTHKVSKALSLTTSVSQTYSSTETISIKRSLSGGYYHLVWQLCDSLILYRKRKGQEAEFAKFLECSLANVQIKSIKMPNS